MHHIVRRTAFRAASSSPSISLTSKPRSIATASPFLLRSRVQAARTAPSAFRRFYSNGPDLESADSEHPAVTSAIDSAEQSATTYAGEATEGLSSGAHEAYNEYPDATTGAAAAAGHAFPARRNRPAPTLRHTRNSRDAGSSNTRAPYDIPPNSGIYIGNLLFDITSSDLERVFSPFGNITAATIATDGRGLSKGYGYVQFETVDAATAAIQAKNEEVFEGRRMLVNYANKTKSQSANNPPSNTLFLGNLAFEMSDADINSLFRDIKNVIDVRVAIDRRTGQPRGFAHAEFVDTESATQAMDELKGKEMYGRPIRFDYSAGTRDHQRTLRSSRGA